MNAPHTFERHMFAGKAETVPAKWHSAVWAVARTGVDKAQWGVFHTPTGYTIFRFRTLKAAKPLFDFLVREHARFGRHCTFGEVPEETGDLRRAMLAAGLFPNAV